MKTTFTKTSNNEFEWFQDARKISVRLPLKGTSLKKIDVYVSDLFLKINVQEKNLVKVIDFKHEVDYQSKENSTLYIDEHLEVHLIKKEPGVWADLFETNLPKEEKMTRRQESMKRKEEEEQKFYKNKQELKIQHDRFSTNEQMRMEEKERNKLEELKKIEKSQAEADLYNSMDTNARFSGTTKKTQEMVNEIQDRKLKEPVEEEDIDSFTEKGPYVKNNEIFTDEDFGYSQVKGEPVLHETPNTKVVKVPEIRAKSSVQIPFTDKVYPHLAAREQHYKDPPLPKIKNTEGKSDKDSGEGIEQKNPLWLKDKGDEFFRNKDFYSALNAYNSAFKLDNTQIACIQNRAVCHLYLYNYKECLNDCETIIKFVNQLPEEAKLNPTNEKLSVKSRLRKSVCLAWNGLLEEAVTEVTETRNQFQGNTSYAKEISQIEEIVRQRAESIKKKKLGDSEFRKAQYEKAESYYLQALQEDPENEIIFGNLALIYVKQGLYEKAVEYCDKQLAKISLVTKFSNFNPTIPQSNSDCKPIIVKSLVRKASALKELKKFQESIEIAREALRYEENNKIVKELLKDLETKLNDEQIKKSIDKGNQCLRDGKISEALEIYTDCLKKINPNEYFDQLSVLLNKSACHMKLEQWEDIISISLRGLKIIRNIKNKALGFQKVSMNKEQQEKLNNFEVRFLARRGNAYLKQNQVYNAKSDLEEALKLDPKNETLREDLEKLNIQLKN